MTKLITGNNILTEIIDELKEDYKPEEYKGYLKDVLQNGCESGVVSSLTYYYQTGEFHDRHQVEIWDMVYDHAQNEGLNCMEYIAEMRGSEIGTMTQLKNKLAWYAYEQKVFELLERLDHDETFQNELYEYLLEESEV